MSAGSVAFNAILAGVALTGIRLAVVSRDRGPRVPLYVDLAGMVARVRLITYGNEQ